MMRKLIYLTFLSVISLSLYAQRVPFEYEREQTQNDNVAHGRNPHRFLSEGRISLGYDYWLLYDDQGLGRDEREQERSGLLTSIETRLMRFCIGESASSEENLGPDDENFEEQCPENRINQLLLFPTEVVIKFNLNDGTRVDFQRARVGALKFLLSNRELQIQLASYFQQNLYNSMGQSNNLVFRGVEIISAGITQSRRLRSGDELVFRVQVGARVGKLNQISVVPADRPSEEATTVGGERTMLLHGEAIFGMKIWHRAMIGLLGGIDYLISRGVRIQSYYIGVELGVELFRTPTPISLFLRPSYGIFNSEFTTLPVIRREALGQRDMDFRIQAGVEVRF